MSDEVLELLNNGFILATLAILLKSIYLIISMKFQLSSHTEKIKDLEDFVYPKTLK